MHVPFCSAVPCTLGIHLACNTMLRTGCSGETRLALHIPSSPGDANSNCYYLPKENNIVRMKKTSLENKRTNNSVIVMLANHHRNMVQARQ